MSVNPKFTSIEQYTIGNCLSKLREQEILIIASGGTVHNLGALKMAGDDGKIDEWAIAFDTWLEHHIEKWDLVALFNYKSLAPAADFAVSPLWK